MSMIPPTHWFRNPPWYFSICYNSSPIRVMAMNSSFLNYMSTGKVGFWYYTSSFVFFSQYYWMMFLMIWSFCSILIPCSLWVVLVLRSFSFFLYCKVCSNRVSKYFIILSKKIIFCFAVRISSVSNSRMYLYVLWVY